MSIARRLTLRIAKWASSRAACPSKALVDDLLSQSPRPVPACGQAAERAGRRERPEPATSGRKDTPTDIGTAGRKCLRPERGERAITTAVKPFLDTNLLVYAQTSDPRSSAAREPSLRAASSACRGSPNSPRSPVASSSAALAWRSSDLENENVRGAVGGREPPVRRPRATRPASSSGRFSQALQQPSNASATGPILRPRPSRPRLRLERFHAIFTSSFPGIGRGQFRDSDTQ